PRVAVEVPSDMGSPDGMTIDEEGKLWVAHWGGSCVARWDPMTGKLLQKVTVPGPHTTSCAFGGENLDILNITTARQGLNEDQLRGFHLSGGVFSVKPGVRGVPADFFEEQDRKAGYYRIVRSSRSVIFEKMNDKSHYDFLQTFFS